jgi:hypothetical protein
MVREIDDRQGIVNLYHPSKEFCCPQIIKFKGSWYPGREAKLDLPTVEGVVGFTGKAYRSYDKDVIKSEHQQHWIGIDIDGKDNGGQVDANFVASLVPEGRVRISRSGCGCHVLFKLTNPYLVGKDHSVRPKINNTLKPYLDRLRANGVLPCTSHPSNFYLLGGLNKWVSYPETTINLNFDVLDVAIPADSGRGANINLNELSGRARRFFTLLQDKGIITINKGIIKGMYGIVSKTLYLTLVGSEFEFETVSTMQNNDVNGFIRCNGVVASVIIRADNKSVLDIYC